jgi:hypothetical protein
MEGLLWSPSICGDSLARLTFLMVLWSHYKPTWSGVKLWGEKEVPWTIEIKYLFFVRPIYCWRQMWHNLRVCVKIACHFHVKVAFSLTHIKKQLFLISACKKAHSHWSCSSTKSAKWEMLRFHNCCDTIFNDGYRIWSLGWYEGLKTSLSLKTAQGGFYQKP